MIVKCWRRNDLPPLISAAMLATWAAFRSKGQLCVCAQALQSKPYNIFKKARTCHMRLGLAGDVTALADRRCNVRMRTTQCFVHAYHNVANIYTLTHCIVASFMPFFMPTSCVAGAFMRAANWVLRVRIFIHWFYWTRTHTQTQSHIQHVACGTLTKLTNVVIFI